MRFLGSPFTGSNAGASLVTVMIAAGLLAAAAVLITQLAISSKKTAERSVSGVEFDALIAQLHSIVANEVSCRTAIGGPSDYVPAQIFPFPSRAESFTLTAWKNPSQGGSFVNFKTTAGQFNPIVLYSRFSTAGTPAVFLAPFTGGGPTAVQPSNMIGTLLITKLGLITGGVDCPHNNRTPVPACSNRTYSTYLYVEAARPNLYGWSADMPNGTTINNATGAGTTTIPLNVYLDSSSQSIVSCSGYAFSNSTGSLPVCLSDESLTYAPTIAGGAPIVQCVRVVCPTGTYRKGYNVDTSVQCGAP
ncbi:MAG: hypothetical protein P4M08_10195 [Oligoflexia bacterium]|nr:hypothetical protein [Oligoflexia bacterium]